MSDTREPDPRILVIRGDRESLAKGPLGIGQSAECEHGEAKLNVRIAVARLCSNDLLKQRSCALIVSCTPRSDRLIVEACCLRKDRGRNPDGSERENDNHLTIAEKIDARKRTGRA